MPYYPKTHCISAFNVIIFSTNTWTISSCFNLSNHFELCFTDSVRNLAFLLFKSWASPSMTQPSKVIFGLHIEDILLSNWLRSVSGTFILYQMFFILIQMWRFKNQPGSIGESNNYFKRCFQYFTQPVVICVIRFQVLSHEWL